MTPGLFVIVNCASVSFEVIRDCRLILWAVTDLPHQSALPSRGGWICLQLRANGPSQAQRTVHISCLSDLAITSQGCSLTGSRGRKKITRKVLGPTSPLKDKTGSKRAADEVCEAGTGSFDRCGPTACSSSPRGPSGALSNFKPMTPRQTAREPCCPVLR